MKKYKVSLSVDQNWIERFDLTFEAESEQEAEEQARADFDCTDLDCEVHDE